MNHLVHIDPDTCSWAQIMDSLQYLVDEFHVDGFCFVNAACLVTGPHGQELSRPVLVEAITFDPVLASTKLIADSCSPFNGIWKVTKKKSSLLGESHSPVHLLEVFKMLYIYMCYLRGRGL